MLAISGFGSTIAQELIKLLKHTDDESIAPIRIEDGIPHDIPMKAQRYLLCAGVMVGGLSKYGGDERKLAFEINFGTVISICEDVLEANPQARICVIGSESGISGSFDRIYAGMKAALHNYVETRRVGAQQQLVAIAPSIIIDSGMTQRRIAQDHELLEKRRQMHPKKRFLRACEVARLVQFLLYMDAGFITNTVIRMNGGEHTR